MELLMVPVPLFDRHIAVDSYYFRYQKGNDLLEANRSPSNEVDGAVDSPLLETLNLVGLEAFTMGKPIFVPLNNLAMLTRLETKCSQPPEKVVFVFDKDTKPEEEYLRNIERLKGLGFRFAAEKLMDLDEHRPLLMLCDFIFLNAKFADCKLKLFQVKKEFPHLRVVITNIDNSDAFQRSIKEEISLLEGRFYRTPITQESDKNVSPLQANLIKLLNLVQDESFEFDQVADIVQRDTALSVSLMRLVNSPWLGLRKKVKTIKHAVTILGQQEVRKWVTTAVSKLLGSEKPDEITKLSLIRAKFCENLAEKFRLAPSAQSLFLMGLFSVLDVILDMSMEEALELVMVSDSIREALVGHTGKYYPVYDFLIHYEMADWFIVSRILIMYDLTPGDIYECYINAACWYRDLISGEESSRKK